MSRKCFCGWLNEAGRRPVAVGGMVKSTDHGGHLQDGAVVSGGMVGAFILILPTGALYFRIS